MRGWQVRGSMKGTAISEDAGTFGGTDCLVRPHNGGPAEEVSEGSSLEVDGTEIIGLLVVVVDGTKTIGPPEAVVDGAKTICPPE